MCGICGIVGPWAQRPEAKEVVWEMTRTMAHRGPDGEGLAEGPGFVLGHRRLAIIDQKGGAQPMSTADNRLVLTYNGEIYNYLELRQDLFRQGFEPSLGLPNSAQDRQQSRERCCCLNLIGDPTLFQSLVVVFVAFEEVAPRFSGIPVVRWHQRGIPFDELQGLGKIA